MQKNNVKIMAVSAVVIVICLLASWQYTSVDGDSDDSQPFAEGLVGGDAAAAYELLAPELKAEYEPLGGAEYFGVLLSTLQYSTELQYGPYVSIGETYSPESGISCTPMTYTYSGALVWTHTGDEGVDAFYITPRELPNGNAVPEGIVETSVQVGADDMKALDGVIASSEGSDHSVAAVLVSGSGPQGMDCAFGENRIFQQIAWGLAQQGVDVLRYDDRTYAYPWDSVELGNSLDIGYETVDDAVSAAALLKGMGYEKVVLIGHSLGGMMAPAIVQESDGLYDGMVSMAGSPRSLAEISYDQNMLLIEAMPDGELKDQSIQYVEAQLALAGSLDSMTEEQLLTTTVFGMSAYYLKSIDDYAVADIALALDIPMLFIQGMSDWQVSYERDHGAWMDILDGKENVRGVMYAGLNHLFCSPGQYDGDSSDYYLSQMTVNPTVIDDLAGFVLSV